MTHQAIKDRIEKRNGGFYSVEFEVKDLSCRYQFRIRRNGAGEMFVLIREDSRLVNLLRVGDMLKMTYYSVASPYPAGTLKTMVCGVSRQRQGRFKGHCTVALDIREEIPAQKESVSAFPMGSFLFGGGTGGQFTHGEGKDVR